MKKEIMKHEGDAIDPESVALVSSGEEDLILLMPADPPNRNMRRSEVLLAALAMRCSDDDWVEEQLNFMAEVRRQFEAGSASKKLN